MKLLLLGVRPWNDWDKAENKPGKRLGTNYSVLRLKNRGPVIVNVKVPGDAVITDAAIRESFKSKSVIWAEFEDYEEDMYVRNGVAYHTATAVSLVLDDDGLVID